LDPSQHNSSYSPGDTLSIGSGTYNYDYNWKLTASGSASGGYITLQCAANFGSKIRTINNNQDGIILTQGASYWDIRGCDVSPGGADAEGIAISGAFSSPFGAIHHIIIEGNAVHGAACDGIEANGNTNVNGSTAYAVDYITIRNNLVYSNGLTCGSYHASGISIYEPVRYNTTSGYHLIIQGNTSYSNHDCDSGCGTGSPTDGNGIILDDFKYSQNSTLSGLYSSGYTPTTLVANNVSYGNGGRGIHIFESQNATVQNNTAWGNNQDSSVCSNSVSGGYEIGAIYSTATSFNYNEAQSFSGSCDSYQTYAFEDEPSGTSSTDTFTYNTGFTVTGSNNLVGYAASPPSAYYSTLSGYSFGSTNQ